MHMYCTAHYIPLLSKYIPIPTKKDTPKKVHLKTGEITPESDTMP